MARRSGISLTEVLVTIFIMAIGLMALMTLFPLGALTMAQAIKDDRAAHVVGNAVAQAEVWGYRNGPFYYPGVAFTAANAVRPGDPRDPFVAPGLTTIGAMMPDLAGAQLDEPSYWVYVDPFGTLVANTSTPELTGLLRMGNYPASVGHPGFPRVLVRNATTFSNATVASATRNFYLWDDIHFPADGSAPLGIPGTPFERGSEFSWAYFLHRPRASDRSVVNLTVVVYMRRPISLPDPEPVYQAIYNALEPNIVTLGPNSLGKAEIRKGQWILDATFRDPTGNPTRHPPYLYRVVGVTELANNAMQLELDRNLRTPNISHAIVMKDVVEVFEKGPGRIPSN